MVFLRIVGQHLERQRLQLLETQRRQEEARLREKTMLPVASVVEPLEARSPAS